MKPKIKIWISLLVVVPLMPLVAWALAGLPGPFEDGVTAYEHGDYAAAIELWRPLAERGDGDAQQAIGLLYDLGYGVSQDFAKAGSWYRRAAEGGNRNGQFRFGFMYEWGLGVNIDRAQAAFWYRKAADQGITPAETQLAYMYLNGLG